MKNIGVAAVLALVGLVLIMLLLGWFDAGQADLRADKTAIAREQTRLLAPLWLAVKRVLVTALGVAGGSAALLLAVAAIVALLSTPNLIRMTWLRSWLVKPGRYGAQYPALAVPDGNGHFLIQQPVNEPGAQKVAALTTGLAPDARLQGSAARAALRNDPQETLMPEQTGPLTVTPQEVTTIDPQKAPHFLLLGETGCGKSTAVYAIADALRKTIPCEFVVLDREGPNWNEQAAAITVPGYLAALEKVEEERQRRAGLMREADVDHVSKLDQRLPYIVVILEEAESVYKAMTLHGRSQGVRYTALVRDIASMGRKQGILLVVATQTGTSEVFDVPTRKNLNHKLFFRNEPAVGDAWGIPREIGLSRLATGTAYSLNHGALVTFPHASRPRLPRSPLYYEQRLALPADAEADGLGAEDMPDSGSGTVLEPQNERVYALDTPSNAGTVPVPVPPQRIDRRRPTAIEAYNMRAHYARTHSKTAVCMTFYGYKNGDCWDWVEQALRGEI